MTGFADIDAALTAVPNGCPVCTETIRDIYASFSDNGWPEALQNEIAGSVAIGAITGHHGRTTT